MTTAVKQAVAEIAASLPENATWDDAMYRLYVRQKIEEGLEDVAQGRTIPHEEEFRDLDSEA